MKIEERLNWLMGVKFEDDTLPMLTDNISCPYDGCENRGNFTNCYGEQREECYQYGMWKRCADTQ